MVPERLPVGRDRDKFGTIAGGEPLDPRGGVAHQGSEGDVVRERAVIEEQGDAAAAGGAMPAGTPARRHALDLVRGQNGEADPLGGQYVERSEEHTSELQSPCNLVCRLLLEKKKISSWESGSTVQGKPGGLTSRIAINA